MSDVVLQFLRDGAVSGAGVGSAMTGCGSTGAVHREEATDGAPPTKVAKLADTDDVPPAPAATGVDGSAKPTPGAGAGGGAADNNKKRKLKPSGGIDWSTYRFRHVALHVCVAWK